MFEDYGADVKVRDPSFAYLDGTFQAELPVGDVYVEITKGFEYQPVRSKVRIEPGSREESSGTREMSLRESVHVAGPGWLAARCSSRLGPVTWWQFAVQAHTSPVYLTIPGQELLSEAAATYMLTLIDGAQTWAETLATRTDQERLKQVRRVCEDARVELHLPAAREWARTLK
jgi:hypothetical protein